MSLMLTNDADVEVTLCVHVSGLWMLARDDMDEVFRTDVIAASFLTFAIRSSNFLEQTVKLTRSFIIFWNNC